jgi:hypothetical protein
MRQATRDRLTALWIALATVAACEIGLRLADLPVLRTGVGEHTLGHHYDVELGWAPDPNASPLLKIIRTIHVQSNSLGLRDVEFKPDGRPIMMFIGDSYTWGMDAEAEERFTNLLRGELPGYQIVNAGVIGYGTDQEYLLLQRLWNTIKPNILVLIFCTANDRHDNSSNVRYDDYHKPYFTIENDALVVHGQPVPISRQIYIQRYWIVRHSFVARVFVAAYLAMTHPRVMVPDPTEKLVSAIQEFAQSRGTTFLVGLQLSDPALMQHLAARKIPFTSFEGAEEYGPDSTGHWTPAGHRLVTERLLRLFAENGIARAPASR